MSKLRGAGRRSKQRDSARAPPLHPARERSSLDPERGTRGKSLSLLQRESPVKSGEIIGQRRLELHRCAGPGMNEP
jgi:hypothetical protein